MKKKKNRFSSFDFYMPVFENVGSPCVYEAELYGLSHDEAEVRYLEELEEGIYYDL